MSNLNFSWTRINNDTNGNTRYVLHFLNLNTRAELDAVPWIDVSQKYAIAVKRANCIGGKKFHNKQYGGGIVFQSHSLEDTERSILDILAKDQAKAESIANNQKVED